MGGVSALDYKSIPEELASLDCSWTELCVNGFEDVYYECIEPTVYTYMHTRTKQDTIEELDRLEKILEHKNNIWQTNTDFAWVHPSDGAYHKMYRALKNKIKDMT